MRSLSRFLYILLITLVIAVAAVLIYRNMSPSAVPFDVDELLTSVSAADIYEEENTLQVTAGSVTIISADGSSQHITDNTAVTVGDTISVSEDGAATLTWFDDSVTRLKGGTELSIDAADYNPEDISETIINLELIKGEVWNKINTLIDEDSEFLVGSGDVVAGVRGTTNNIRVDEAGLTVDSIEHSTFVAKRSPGTKALLDKVHVIPGRKGRVAHAAMIAGKVDELIQQDIVPEELQKEWYMGNSSLDRKLERRLQNKYLDLLRKRAGALPGSPDYERKTKALAERLQETSDAGERHRIEQRIAEIHLAEEVLAIKSGERELDHLGERFEALDEQQLKLFDRVFDHALENSERMQEVKQELREQRVFQEVDPSKKLLLREKFVERQLYDLDDYLRSQKVDSEKVDSVLNRIQEEVNELGIADRPVRDIIAGQFLEHLEQLNIDDKPDLKRMIGEHLLDRYQEESLVDASRLEMIHEQYIDRLQEGDLDPAQMELLKERLSTMEEGLNVMGDELLAEFERLKAMPKEDLRRLLEAGELLHLPPEMLQKLKELLAEVTIIEEGIINVLEEKVIDSLNPEINQEELIERIISEVQGLLPEFDSQLRELSEDQLLSFLRDHVLPRLTPELREFLQTDSLLRDRLYRDYVLVRWKKLIESLEPTTDVILKEEPIVEDTTILNDGSTVLEADSTVLVSPEDTLRTEFEGMLAKRFLEQLVRDRFRTYFFNHYPGSDLMRKYLIDGVFRNRVEEEFRANALIR